jgi:hypothetical protein
VKSFDFEIVQLHNSFVSGEKILGLGTPCNQRRYTGRGGGRKYPLKKLLQHDVPKIDWQTMGRSTGFIGLVIVVAIVGYLYTSQLKQVVATTGDAPATAVSTTGVRNDLNAMAQSEQRYLVTHRGYASLDELRTDGDIHVPSRPDFIYDIDAGTDHFVITATYTGPDPKAPKHIRIDDSRNLTQD